APPESTSTQDPPPGPSTPRSHPPTSQTPPSPPGSTPPPQGRRPRDSPARGTRPLPGATSRALAMPSASRATHENAQLITNNPTTSTASKCLKSLVLPLEGRLAQLRALQDEPVEDPDDPRWDGLRRRTARAIEKLNRDVGRGPRVVVPD